MRRSFFLILILIPLFVTAQKKGSNEFSFALANRFNITKRDVSTTLSTANLEMKNTVSQSILGQYTRVTAYNLLLTAGLEFGYQNFRGNINYPFSQYGFVKPTSLSEEYKVNATTYYSNINLGVGYRSAINGIPIDIIIGNLMRIPLTSKQENYNSLAVSVEGAEIYNYYKSGNWGKHNNSGFVSEQISYIYLGSSIKNVFHKKHTLNIGIRGERKLIESNSGLNTVSVYYFDKEGKSVGSDNYLNRQFAINLLLGLTL